MGMYDTIKIYMSCPYCGMAGTFDVQTKDLENMMDTYKPLDREKYLGHVLGKTEAEIAEIIRMKPVLLSFENKAKILAEAFVGNKLRRIDALAVCYSPACYFYSNKIGIIKYGRPRGHGRLFDVSIPISPEGYILYEGLTAYPEKTESTDGWKDKMNEEVRAKFEKALEVFHGDEAIALRFLHLPRYPLHTKPVILKDVYEKWKEI